MRFTIVTPSFNQGKFIAKSLASVRSQKGNFDVEHIILDNCSTDETAEVLSEYQVNHGRVVPKFFVERDSGQTSAINKGFSLATGDIVCWLNTDEWYKEDALAKVAAYFETHPDVDVVFGNCDFVDANGLLVKSKKEFFYSKSMLIFYGCYLPSCATFVRRRVVDADIILNTEFKVTMDFDWYVRIASAGYKFAFIQETIASFTWHLTNISFINSDRRQFERRLVQDRFSGVNGSRSYRFLVYGIMRRFWQFVRISRRMIG